MAIKLPWVEKYRPETINEYVFKSSSLKTKVESWISEGTIPHLLLSGKPGTGKTSLAKLLFNELGINDLDVMVVNASRENSVETIREKIIKFAELIPYGKYKIILLDEATYLSASAQTVLLGILEEYVDITRFIFTTNHPNKILPAIHSRCQHIQFDTMDINEYTAKVATILIEEGIKFDLDVLDTYVKASYPDLRKCINNVELNSQHNILTISETTTSEDDGYIVEMVSLFKAGKIREARKLVCSNVKPEEIEDIYRWMYNNLDMFGDEDKQEQALLIIKQGLVDHTLMADVEINLAAVMVRLSHL